MYSRLYTKESHIISKYGQKYYNRNNISKVKLYISSDIITDIFENVPDTLVFKYKTPLNNEATIIGIDKGILENYSYGTEQIYVYYERGEEE